MNLPLSRLPTPAGGRPAGLPSRRHAAPTPATPPTTKTHASAGPSRGVLPPRPPPVDPAAAQAPAVPTAFIAASIVATAMLGLVAGRRR